MANNKHDHDGDWIEYRRLVLAELSRLESRISSLDKETQDQLKSIVVELKEDLYALDKEHRSLRLEHKVLSHEMLAIKIKSGIWGGLVSAIVALAAFLIKVL